MFSLSSRLPLRLSVELQRERQARFQTNVPLDYKEYGFIADNTPQRILQGAGSTRRSAAAAAAEPANDGGAEKLCDHLETFGCDIKAAD